MSAGRFLAPVVAAVAAVTIAGCGGTEADDAGGLSVARAWDTWAVGAPGSVRAPHAGVSSARRAIAARRRDLGEWRELRAASARTAVAPWFELAMRFVSERAKDPPAGSRAYALVGVAAHDATVAVARRRASGDGEPPSLRPAIAGAASRVLSHAFPEHPRARLDALAEQSAAERVEQGAATAASAAAGLALGRAVAARVIDRADGDRTRSARTVRPPDRPGAWAPPPGSTARPVQPRAGTWTTWVLPSGDAVRPDPPPPFDGPAFRAQARDVIAVGERLTGEQRRIAKFWEGGDGTELPPGIWVRVVLAHLDRRGADDAQAARTMALLTVAMADAGVAAWDAKYAYWLTRPVNAIRELGLDRRWKPYLDTPFFPAYPSGHATYSGAAAEVLAYLFPQERDAWRRRAREASISRVYGGIHFRMDGDVGLEVGRRIGRLVVRRARRDDAS